MFLKLFSTAMMILILPHLLPSIALGFEGTWGSFCNETTPCSSASLLTCQEGKCGCLFNDSMTFASRRKPRLTHSLDGRCVSLVGESCGSLEALNEVLSLDCVDNAFCTSQGECRCSEGFFSNNASSTCVKQTPFGGSCNGTLECSQTLGLECVNGTCRCDSRDAIDSLKFSDDEEERRCLGRPGAPCSSGQCVPNASCQDQGLCQCDPGFEESKGRKVCLGGFSTKGCDSGRNRFCSRTLSCLNGACGCKAPSDQVYHKGRKVCLSLVGGPCKEEESCVPNAGCRKLFEDNGFCQCDEGFVENGNRTCDIGHGHPCSEKCDTAAGLSCRDGLCSCPNPGQVFDDQTLSCHSLIGSFCKKNEGCVKNGHCVLHRNGFLPFGHCECDRDFVVTKDGRCVCQYCDDQDKK